MSRCVRECECVGTEQTGVAEASARTRWRACHRGREVCLGEHMCTRECVHEKTCMCVCTCVGRACQQAHTLVSDR